MAETELDTLINNLSNDLQNAGGHLSRYEEHKMYTSEMTRSTTRRPTGSPYMPRRNTEQKGWYKQWANDMGHPRTAAPILKKPHIFDAAVSDLKYRSNYSLDRSPSRSPRFRSISPRRTCSPKNEKNVQIGPVTEIIQKQDFYRHRDAHQGKPLPGDNTFMHTSWPYGLNHIGDAYNKKRKEPESHLKPGWSKESLGKDGWGKDGWGKDSTGKDVLGKYGWGKDGWLGGSRGSSRSRDYNRSRSSSPRRPRSVPPGEVMEKKVVKPTTESVPSSPLPEYLKNLRHIVVAQVPVPVPPKFGTLTYGGRWANAAEGPYIDGPPCNLCHKPITEKRCIIHENCNYHCWHFVCSFCFKTLKENDFLMAVDKKPYCNNCYKRMFP